LSDYAGDPLERYLQFYDMKIDRVFPRLSLAARVLINIFEIRLALLGVLPRGRANTRSSASSMATFLT
jgi:hypothetical protein